MEIQISIGLFADAAEVITALTGLVIALKYRCKP